jgi:vesicle coat complex subunit
LNGAPEIQFVTLKNIIILLQYCKTGFLQNDIRAFFCKYDDPAYVKLSKLEILVKLTTLDNVNKVLPELKG